MKKAVIKSKSNKGFYILLCFCFLAIFGSGILISSYSNTYKKSNDQAAKNVQVEKLPSIIPSAVPKKTPEAAPSPTPDSEQANSSLQEEPAAETVAKADPLKLTMPMDGDVSVPFAQDSLIFSKTLEDWRTHNGIDIAGDLGTHVKAAGVGVVDDIYDDPSLGTTVVISHSGNVKTYYSNLAKDVVVQKGQNVAAGDVIGGVGETAMAEVAQAAHLHFSVTQNGQYVNPVEMMGQ